MSELLLEKISHDELLKQLQEFYNYAKKRLKLDRDPQIFLKRDNVNSEDFLGKTGYYDPEEEKVVLYIVDRHAKDIVRSLSHELIHHTQKLRGITDNVNLNNIGIDPSYALHNKDLRTMEKQAFLWGDMIFRDWTDKQKKKRKNTMAEQKIAKKDYDHDGKKESPSAEYRGSVDAAIKASNDKKKKNKTIKKENDMKIKMTNEEEVVEAKDDETEEIVGLGSELPPRNLADLPPDVTDEEEEEEDAGGGEDEKLGGGLPLGRVEDKFNDMDAEQQARFLTFLAKKAKDKKAAARELDRQLRAEKETERRASFASLPGAKPPMEESKQNPYPVLFEQRERLLKEAFQTREERVYNELIKRFIKK